ncbi:MAG TPA: hypothetical protein VII43_02630, partial [Opitutaceae bacterium]
MTLGTKGRFPSAIGLLAAASLFVLGPRILERAATPIAGVQARATGAFTENGDIPLNRGIGADGERWDGFPRGEAPPGGGRHWSSWNGSNANQGGLALGPFAAPQVLGLSVCGYDRVEGNRLYLENAATSEKLELTEGNVGAYWAELRLRLPKSWWGVPVVLHALDGSGAYYGWLGVGEPRDVPAYAAWWNSFARKIHGFAGVGLVLFLFQSAAASLLKGRREIPPGLLPLASFALVALAGYGAFWVFFASAVAGKILVWALLGLSAFLFVRGPAAGSAEPAQGRRTPILLMAAIGAFYLGVLLLYGSDRTLADLSAHRFIDNLAIDNEIPQMFSDRLVHGEDPRHLAFGWWSSGDRPPLQTGCDLLVAYPVAASGVNFDTAAQSAGVWMQLAWVCAAWGWLATLGVSPRRSAMIIALLAPTGFLALNTVYVWPKLLAGAFTVGAFCVWLAMRDGKRDAPRDWAVLSLLGTLGFLAQSGAAFSLLAWLPFAAARMRRIPLRSWAAAAAVFAALVLPWMAYQRYYNPPANLLLKWHLGGANIPDARGTWETIRSGYASLSPSTLLHYRMVNLATMFKGPWLDWLAYRGSDVASQRNAEYYGVFFGLGRWILGFVPLAALLFSAWRIRFLKETVSRLGLSVAWCLLTLAVWLSLMFLPESTVIHQGSYACVLMLLLSLAFALWLAHPGAFVFVGLAGLADFAWLWLPPNPTRITPLDHGAAALVVVSAIAVAAIV